MPRKQGGDAHDNDTRATAARHLRLWAPNRTCLVVLGVNPAIGYGLVDIATGEFLLPVQPFPEVATVIQRWELRLVQ